MNKLKELAKILSEDKKVPENIAKQILSFRKPQMKSFLRYYKQAIKNKQVVVISAIKLPNYVLEKIKNQYKKYEIISVVDPSLGGGLKIVKGDITIDSSFKNYINSVINNLKE